MKSKDNNVVRKNPSICGVETKAKITFEAYKVSLSSKKDRKIFLNALMNPPKPNEQLKAAAKRYRAATT